VLWHAYRAAERTALEATVKRWNDGARGRDPTIQLLAVPYDAFPDKISAAVPRGHGPDMFIFAHDRVGDWAESKIVEPIEFWMTEEHADSFLFKVLDSLCYKDSLFGLPLAFKSVVLYYNKELVPTPPRTTDELIAMGRKLTDRSTGRFGLVYWNTLFYFHSPWHFGFGAKIFDDKGDLRVRAPETERAIAFAKALADKASGIVPPETSSTLTTTLFSQGKAAMAISGPWMLGELPATLKVGIAPLPKINATGKPAAPLLGAEAIMMSTKSTQKASAFRAMSFLTGTWAATQRALLARQPVANVAAWRDARVAGDPVLAAFRRQLDSTTVTPGTPEMRLVWTPMDMALQKVIGSGAAVPAAVSDAEAELRRYLQAARNAAQAKR
jgi:arabinogalactan oligomer/maltooligosaccharide transport system substrate-binding protein